MKVLAIDEDSPYLSKVKELWYPNRATLGFLPDGAFIDYARRRQILIVLDQNKDCIGYLIYRVSKMQITLVHLCVHQLFRGKGIAKLLINHLSSVRKDYLGIGLKCRRDYQISNIWPKLGFSARNDRPGRSYDGKPLTFWWLDHGHPSLFTVDQEELLNTKTVVVIDANVFYDFQDEGDIDSIESKSLLADWLPDNLVLAVTEEIFNEVNRCSDLKEIDKRREFIYKFHILRCSNDHLDQISNSLIHLFPEKMTLSDESDLRQLSRAIAGKSPFFVTRDDRLLEISDAVYEIFRTNIIRPCDLIIHFDEWVKGDLYHPIRLAGAQIYINLVKNRQDVILVNTFQSFSQNEKKSDFQRHIRYFLANPDTFETYTITDSNRNYIGLIVYGRQESNKLEIPIFRVIKNSLASTLAKHLLLRSIRLSSSEGRILTKVTDRFLSENVVLALSDSNFIDGSHGWTKFNLAGIETANTISRRLSELIVEHPREKIYLENLSGFLDEAIAKKNIHMLCKVERLLWPEKIKEGNIPNFIVPIKPKWAAELFDEYLAFQDLFGAKPELSLNRENVYYRARHPKVLICPGRILWYVSKDKNCYGTMCIRACSLIDNVVIDKPKELFKRYRRLGVYDWPDLLSVADGDFNKEIMAVQFSDTELLEVPIEWECLKQILADEEGRTAPIQSPVLISDRTFERIYRLGFKSLTGGNLIVG